MNYSNSQRAGVILYLAASLFGGYDKKAIITLNWPQAVLRFHFVEQQAEGKVFIEEVNEGEKL